MPPTPIPLDPAVPMDVTVDLQSHHTGGFRLFTRPTATADWELLKEGNKDATLTVPAARLRQGLHYEFVFFKGPDDFNAVLLFRQKGGSHMVPVTAGGNTLLVEGEVVFT